MKSAPRAASVGAPAGCSGPQDRRTLLAGGIHGRAPALSRQALAVCGFTAGHAAARELLQAGHPPVALHFSSLPSAHDQTFRPRGFWAPVPHPWLLGVLVAGIAAVVAPAQGHPGASPGVSCLTDARVEEVLLIEGVYYLAGAFTHVRPHGTLPGDSAEVARQWFAACDAATGAVLAWDPLVAYTGGGANPGGKALALSTDGIQIYLGGRFNQVGGETRRNAARVDRTTAAVDSWDPDCNDRVQEILVAPDGARVYLGGNFTTVGSSAQPYLAAVSPTNAALDPAFAPVVSTSDGSFKTVYALALAPGAGTLYLGGQFDLVNGAARASAAAVDAATGLVLTSFAPDLADTNPQDLFVQVYEIQIDGLWIYLCGDWWLTEGIGSSTDQRNVNRFDPADGSVDPAFWVATDGGVQACAVDRGGRLLIVGGHFDLVNGSSQPDLFAMSLDDGAIAAWNPGTTGVPGAWGMTIGDGRLAVGGELTLPQPDNDRTNFFTFTLALTELFADGFESGDLSHWSSISP